MERIFLVTIFVFLAQLCYGDEKVGCTKYIIDQTLDVKSSPSRASLALEPGAQITLEHELVGKPGVWKATETSKGNITVTWDALKNRAFCVNRRVEENMDVRLDGSPGVASLPKDTYFQIEKRIRRRDISIFKVNVTTKSWKQYTVREDEMKSNSDIVYYYVQGSLRAKEHGSKVDVKIEESKVELEHQVRHRSIRDLWKAKATRKDGKTQEITISLAGLEGGAEFIVRETKNDMNVKFHHGTMEDKTLSKGTHFRVKRKTRSVFVIERQEEDTLKYTVEAMAIKDKSSPVVDSTRSSTAASSASGLGGVAPSVARAVSPIAARGARAASPRSPRRVAPRSPRRVAPAPLVVTDSPDDWRAVFDKSKLERRLSSHENLRIAQWAIAEPETYPETYNKLAGESAGTHDMEDVPETVGPPKELSGMVKFTHDMTSTEVAREYVKLGKTVAVIDAANTIYPCGKAREGEKGSQEEGLCKAVPLLYTQLAVSRLGMKADSEDGRKLVTEELRIEKGHWKAFWARKLSKDYKDVPGFYNNPDDVEGVGAEVESGHGKFNGKFFHVKQIGVLRSEKDGAALDPKDPKDVINIDVIGAGGPGFHENNPETHMTYERYFGGPGGKTKGEARKVSQKWYYDETGDSQNMKNVKKMMYNLLAQPKKLNPALTTLVTPIFWAGAFNFDRDIVVKLMAETIRDHNLGYETIHIAEYDPKGRLTIRGVEESLAVLKAKRAEF